MSSSTITPLLQLILLPLHNTGADTSPYNGPPRYDLYYICLTLLSLHYYNSSSYSHCTTQELTSPYDGPKVRHLTPTLYYHSRYYNFSSYYTQDTRLQPPMHRIPRFAAPREAALRSSQVATAAVGTDQSESHGRVAVCDIGPSYGAGPVGSHGSLCRNRQDVQQVLSFSSNDCVEADGSKPTPCASGAVTGDRRLRCGVLRGVGSRGRGYLFVLLLLTITTTYYNFLILLTTTHRSWHK